MDEWRKPPLGAMPEKLWLETRVDVLIGALERYHHMKKNTVLMAMWSEELNRRLKALVDMGELD